MIGASTTNRSDISAITSGFLESLARRDNSAPDDVKRDGLLYCGKCGEPKQAVIDWLPDANGERQKRVVPVVCKCMRGEEEKAEAEDRRRQFVVNMRQLRGTYGIADSSTDKYTFAVDDSPNSKISRMARRYAEQWDSMREDNIGILLYGGIGTGKSFYAGCIVNALMERMIPAAMTSIPRLLGILQGNFERAAILDHMRQYRLLVLDDLGAERDSGYAAEQVYAIVDARYRAKLPLIVTSNIDLHDMESETNVQQRRIYDRIIECCPIQIRMDGVSRRKSISDERRKKARALMAEAMGR